MNSQLISVDIPGLDLALGGGIWTVRRLPDVPASANILIRGAPGSGKTIFGTHLAGALGRALKGDVAYGCIELLPIELQAQYTNLRGVQAPERVVVPPFNDVTESPPSACRIFAGLLDLGTSGQEQERLGPAVLGLLDEIARAGGKPRVLVIDSLSDGYGLGSAVPRLLADALCKLAVERGLVFILLEEIADPRPSAWSFAVDCVLELSIGDSRHSNPSAPIERQLKVLKNRFGPAETGPHSIDVGDSGIHLYPHITAYSSVWAERFLVPRQDMPAPADQIWSIDGTEFLDRASSWPSTSFRNCVTAVYGMESEGVFQAAKQLGSMDRARKPYPGTTLFVDLRSSDLSTKRAIGQGFWHIGAGDPYVNVNELLSVMRMVLRDVYLEKKFVTKVLIGDLRSTRNFWNPDSMRRAIAVLISLLRKLQIPVVLFETTQSIAYEPNAVDMADVVVRVSPFNPPRDSLDGYITDIETGTQGYWSINLTESK